MQVWGESGAASPGATSLHSGAGAGSGAYAEEPALAGVAAGTVLSIVVGAGGTSTASSVTGGTVAVTASPGGSAGGTIAGSGGAAGSNTVAFAGSAGGTGFSGSLKTGAGGGGSPGASGAGTAGAAGSAGGAGGSAGAGGGAAGGNGGAPGSPGAAGSSPGAGPGGGGNNGNQAAGAVSAGQVIITWSVISYTPFGYAAAAGVVATAKHAVSAFKGYLSFAGGPLPIAPVNQWAGTFAQPATFGNPPPALQSVVVPLTPGASVGGGSGVPSAGNWLFCIVGMNEQGSLPGFTIGTNDDIHSFWRPAGTSLKSAATRTSAWYAPNIARTVQDVYVAPNGAFDALTVLVIEVAGLGAWDTVTGVFTSYAAAATSLSLTLAAPASQAFFLAAAAGDSTASTQTVSGTGWTALQTVTATNGADHTCDSVLTSAYRVTTGTATPTIAASPAVDLSGVIIGVLTSAPSPIPAGGNTAWPYIVAEMAFGSGFQTPADEMTWTAVTKRWWSWHETTGIQYQLGQLQATDCDMELDNWDGAFSPSNPGSLFYSNALNVNMSFNMAYPHAGLSGWSPSGGAAIVLSSAQAYASAPDAVATYSMQVTPDGVTANPGAQSEMIPVAAGQVYTPSGWFYSVAGWSGGGQAVVNWYDASHTFLSSSSASPLVIPAGAWTQAVNLAVTAPVGAALATITPRLAGTPAALPFWVAEAALVPGSLPAATGLVATGTPVRLRMALGTLGGVTANRWYQISRNASSWPEKRNKALRGFVPAKLTDIWSVASASCPTPYRGEVEQDNPVSWYPMDDQASVNGVLPTFLRNAAKGNTTPLTINLSPNGIRVQNQQLVDGGGDVVLGTSNPGTIATYQVAQDGGWMPGDPQSSPQSAATGNPVTSQPGSAAWQQTGESGTTGSYGFYLLANDNFPPLASGMSFEVWFKMPFFGTSSLAAPNLAGPQSPPCNTPYAALTIAGLMTASAPVALLQLDVAGHLSLITYNGGTPASHSIYSTSDLRSETYHQIVLTTDGNAWTVCVDGGLTATVSGSGAGMTSAWSYLLLNGDFGSAGGANPSAYAHSGNIWLSHAITYAGRLPAFRVRAHYAAAITALGYLPAPTSVAANFVHSGSSAGDGSNAVGTVNGSAGYPPNTQTVMSAVVVAQAGTYQSGPSAWAAVADWASSVAMAAWTQWNGLAPLFAVYTNSQVGGETQAATACGGGDGFVSGWGGSASPKGFCHVGSGSGAAPPTAPTPLGDTVAQRLERILHLGNVTAPNRAIDPAPLLVQGATDVGGQQCGQATEAIVLSDDGMFAIGNGGEIFYRQRPHLASDVPVWQLGPDVSAGQLPYSADQEFATDPNRIVNDVEITPFSPDGASLPIVTPSNATGVNASQKQAGARSLQVTSYLQDQDRAQNQADWLFSTFGTNRRRVAKLTVDAAPHPAAWPFVCGVNVGDVLQVFDMPVSGAPASQGTYRVTELTRNISFGANGASVTGAVEIIGDFEPDSYWS